MRLLRCFVIAISVLVVASAAWIGAHDWSARSGATGADPAAVAIGGPFTLLDAKGDAVTDQTLRGKWLLVYFGYTSCPDACPTALNNIAGAIEELGPLADRIQPLFITLDPERDTRQVLAEYTAAFDKRILGLTGTPGQIRRVAAEYRIRYAKHEDPDTGEYGLDHSSVIYLMDPAGRYVARFGDQTDAGRLSAKLREALAAS